jgi:hypothetical protein
MSTPGEDGVEKYAQTSKGKKKKGTNGERIRASYAAIG